MLILPRHACINKTQPDRAKAEAKLKPCHSENTQHPPSFWETGTFNKKREKTGAIIIYAPLCLQ